MSPSSASPEDSPVNRPDSESTDELESLSVQFSEQLAIGQQADVNFWLKQVPQDKRQALLERLNSMVMRFQSGRIPSAPLSKGEDVCAAPVELSQSRVDSIAEDRATRDTDMENRTGVFSGPSKLLGNYALEQELGRGGMGVVFRARHTGRGEVVALKVLPDVDGTSLHRFKREFRSLADLSHPNLIGLRTLESDGDNWFFTMELVERARSFRSFIRADNVLNVSRLRGSLTQLVQGVHALHQHGVIHRDLKPSNVLVDQAGRVVILDFGLVSELERRHQTITARDMSGTPAYMAPETVACEEETYACDWYAVGTMLYEVLCGQLPFAGESLQILSDKRTQDAPPLPNARLIPDDLRQLCMDLLKRDPRQRPSYSGIMAILGGPDIRQEASAEHHDMLLGREWHLATIKTQYERVHEFGKPIAVFISGKSGEGKSALVERFLRDLAESDDVTLLAGRCYDRESVPFKALDSLIDALASYLRQLETTEAAILLPDDANFLAQVFPVLSRVDVIAKRPAPDVARLDQQQVRKRAFGALRELLRRVSKSRQVVMFCDDLQWGDADSAEVLIDVLAGDNAPRLLLLGSYRSDEADDSSFLRRWKELQANPAGSPIQTEQIPVGPLSLEHCVKLLTHRFPLSPPNIARKLTRLLFEETGGNAFLISELFECLDIDKGTVRRIPLNQVLAHKLSRLPSDAVTLLNILAVAGQAVDQFELIRASGCTASAHATLSLMRNERLVRMLGEESATRLDTYHDKIRETVMGSLGTVAIQQVHAKLAHVIESQSTEISRETIERMLAGEDIQHPNIERIYDLSVHFAGAQLADKAATYSFLAAEQARRQFSHEVAVRQYQICMSQQPSGLLEHCHFRINLGFAHSLLLGGKYVSAIEQSQIALEHAATHLQRALALELLGELALKQARFNDCMTNYNAALRELGIRVPRSNLGMIAASGWQTLRHIFQSSLFRSHGIREAPIEEQTRLRLFARAFYAGGFTNTPYFLYTLLYGMNRGERWKPTRELAMQYSLFGCILAVFGMSKRSILFVDRAIRMQQQSKDDFGEAHAFGWSAISYFAGGYYSKAVEHAEKAIVRFEKAGDPWEMNLVQLHHACALFMLGRLDEAIVTADEAFRRSAYYEDTRTNCTLYCIARSSEGRNDIDAYIPRVKLVDEDIISTCNLHKALGISLLKRGNIDEAIEKLELACTRPLQNLLPHFHVIPALPLLVSALRARAQRDGNRRDLARAHRLARRAAWLCRLFPTEYAFALREYGQLLAQQGKHKRAAKVLEKSCGVAARQDATFELAQSNLALARVKVDMGSLGADQELARAEAEIKHFHDLIDKGLKNLKTIA